MFTKDQPGVKTSFWIFIAVMLMAIDNKTSALQQFRIKADIIAGSIERLVSLPLQSFHDIATALSARSTLLRDNESLKNNNLLLNAKVQRLQAIEAENNQLKALMHAAKKVQGKLLIAELIAVDIDPFINQIILDKGTADGVFIGQPILDANGVIGKIIEVSQSTSRALLIIDNHSGVPVQNTRNGVRAIAIGDSYTKQLHLVNVPQTIDIETGDTLVTSGLGEHYPAGYPVGTVTLVDKQPGLQFVNIAVKPASQPDRVRHVLLVWPNKTVSQDASS